MIAILLALSCGIDHWPVKVLRDPGAARALAPAPIHSTIAALGALPRTSRRRAYVIDGTVKAIRREADGDLHVVLIDGSASIIIEFPDPRCVPADSKALAAVRRAWLQAADLRGRAARAGGRDAVLR